ncbi:MAG TPA: hypothetical protein VFY25_10430, partial [Anaerolineales bacterium]|nr:hypothetical protein [Anaerolineales bacterium]
MSGVPVKNSVQRESISTGWQSRLWIPVLLLGAIAVRVAGLEFRSIDIQDFLLDWYSSLAMHGFQALRQPFSNYTPPYLYLLYLATRTNGLIPDVVAIKLISIFFDLVNAFLVYKILKIRYPDGMLAWMGAAVFLVLPTVLLNSAYWGQADAIYTCFLLACLLFLLKEQPLPAMIFLGIAFGFKAQAVFLAPFILLLVVKRIIPLLYLGIIPLVYLLLMVPAALTGRPMLDLLTIYLDQAGVYQSLSEHAPNLYLFISNRFYSPVAAIGIGVTALVVVTWVILYAHKLKG